MTSKETGWGDPKSMQNAKNYWDDRSVTIQSIPTIGGVSDNNTGNLVAAPSSYVGQQVSDLNLLNKKLVLPTKSDSGIDLSLLTSVVKPVETVYENDEIWDYNHLIIDISKIVRSQTEEPVKTVEENEPFNPQDMMPFEELEN